MSKTIDIVCIMDRSGSMSSLMSDVVGGYNSFIEEQKAQPYKAKVTLTIFDDVIETIRVREKLAETKELTIEECGARNGTALLDAVGKTINNLPEKVQNKKEVILLIYTDGQENSSTEYDLSTVKDLLEAKKELGWTVQFFAAGADAFNEASRLGIQDTTFKCAPTKDGMSKTYALSSQITTEALRAYSGT